VSYFVERLAFLQESGSREVLLSHAICVRSEKRNLDLFQGFQGFGLFFTKNMSNIDGSGRLESPSL